LKIWYGRPSGHSAYYSIVASYDNDVFAAKASSEIRAALERKELSEDCDWHPDDATVSAAGKDVSFSVYSAGYLVAVEEAFKASSPKKVEVFEDMQELVVVFSFDSASVTLEDIKVLLLIRYPDLNYLFNHSQAKIEQTNEKTRCIFLFRGDYSYEDGELLGHPISDLDCEVTVLSE
jgi:hypothetical protein